MNNEKILEVLGNLRFDIDENWDREEYENEIKESIEALDYAIDIIKSTNVCGCFEIEGCKYLISK